MPVKQLGFFRNTTIAIVSLVALLAFKGEKDSLHKRIFYVNLTESKDGEPVKKSISDKFYFKDGKVFSDYLHEKFGYSYIRYRINHDTTYMDSTNTRVRELWAEASATDEDDQTAAITFTTVEWDIDGVVKITRKDKLKKYYDFAGREKGGKPKKPKKKKDKGNTPEGTSTETDTENKE